MNDKKINAVQVWKQMEDLLAPQLSFSLADRAVYSHLLRHSRLEGKLKLQFSISWLARGVGLSSKFTRDTVRRLIARGVLQLVECNCRSQHVVRVRLPLEVKEICAEKIAAHRPAPAPPRRYQHRGGGFPGKAGPAPDHPRTRGRPLLLLLAADHPHRRCLDHVVPRAKLGQNSYRNLVSCCLDCNSRKGERSAEERVRWLDRERRLSADDLSSRLRA